MIRTDNSLGVAPVVGFLLVLAILAIAAGQYQTTVVPNEERDSEAQHFQNVVQDMENLRSEIISTSGSGQRGTQTIDIGHDYDVFGVTQPPISGTLLHRDTDENIKLLNAENEQEASSFWTGQRVVEYETGFIEYGIDYNRYQQAGELFIEHGFLYESTADGESPRDLDIEEDPFRIIDRSDQPIIDDRTISLYTKTDGIEEDLISAGRPQTTVEVEPVSPTQGGEMNTITLSSDATGNGIFLYLPTRLPLEIWEEEILVDELEESYWGGDPPDGVDEDQTGYITDIYDAEDKDELLQDVDDTTLETNIDDNVEPTDDAIIIEMSENEVFNFRSSRVHIETDAQSAPTMDSEEEYIAVTDQSANIREQTTIQLEAEARDKFNNGVIGQQVISEVQDTDGECIGGYSQAADDVEPSCEEGEFTTGDHPGIDISDEDGNVSFEYQSPEVPEDQTVTILYEFLE